MVTAMMKMKEANLNTFKCKDKLIVNAFPKHYLWGKYNEAEIQRASILWVAWKEVPWRKVLFFFLY